MPFAALHMSAPGNWRAVGSALGAFGGAGEQRGWATRQHFSPTQDVTQPLLRLVLRQAALPPALKSEMPSPAISRFTAIIESWTGAIMRLTLTVAVVCCTTLGAIHAQGIVPPEIVRLESIRVDDDMKIVTVGNAKGHYTLTCNVKADGCITPQRNKNYLLFNKDTRWKMPGAKEFLTLTGIQDWTIKYNKGENIGLVPEDAKGDLGMFLLDPAGGGSEQDTVLSDGPIIYGTGMSDADRQKAWKHFFMLMVKAVVSQQGEGVLGVKLARRCMPDQDFCTTALDANLVGIGGIKEPRKVLVIVTTDLRDQNKQLSRIVCTRPTKDKQVCREFDTGKLVTDDTGQ